jgi:hypothetical protein
MYGLYTVNGILNSNCRCALMPVIPDEGIEPEPRPEEAVAGQPFVPAQTVAEGIQRAASMGVEIGATADQIKGILADAFAESIGGFREPDMRARYMAQMEEPRIAPEDYQLKVINAVMEAISSGEILRFPTVIVDATGTENAGALGEYKDRVVNMYYRQGRIEVPVDRLGTGATIPNAYRNLEKGTYIHEVGHSLVYDDPETVQRARVELRAQKAFIRRNISWYAVTNARELVAEAYAFSRHPDFLASSPETQKLVTRILEGDN